MDAVLPGARIAPAAALPGDIIAMAMDDPDGAVVELAQPMVEGFLREVSDLTVIANHDVKVTFKIRERE